MGRAIPGFRIDVIDSAGDPCEIGKPGRLRVKGPASLSSYYLDDVATSETFLQDSILTVDVASISGAGDVFVLGRVTDFAVMPSGRGLSISDLNHKLLTLPFVRDGYIAQIKSPDGDSLIGLSVIVALPVGVSPQPQFREQILAALRDVLDGFVLADDAVQFVDRVPRNAHGKLLHPAAQFSLQANFKC